MNSRGRILFNEMSCQEHQALSRKGGIASGKARREKRELIEAEKLRQRAEKENYYESIQQICLAASLLRKTAIEYRKQGLDI